ncbi:PREDICTED: GLABROUS1 enhancer-binding protein-like 1 [Camelina sativa]|uniref:GLABROUS1 enhancer-binding protein-like 1 n=1 Tax=Camelina sativa TaxID=90675 RepID=A0ABM0TQ26_CAMSA|nr:PREDICTED: GLABROUS1 enhancer-binding protein-like 1 [Camelina sativa]
MVSPKHLEFSSSGGAADSDDTFSQQKSPRNPSSKRPAASDAAEEEATKKKKKKKKKKTTTTKLSSPLFIRIWNEEDELSVLKGLVDYRAKTGFQSKIDWDAFYRFLGGSIAEKYSKEQVLGKIRKLKKRFLVHLEKINQGSDPKFTRASDSEAFGFSMMIWGQNEVGHDDGDDDDDDGIDKEMLKEQEEPLNENGLVKVTDNNGTARLEQQRGNGEEMLKEHEDVANTERLNENGAAKVTENGTTAGKESHNNDDDELCAVRDAFETVMSQGLSDYQRKLQLEKLMNIGAGKRRKLSDEWKALCVEERKLNIKKLRFSAKLAEAANDG